jgi:hypothetical protein
MNWLSKNSKWELRFSSTYSKNCVVLLRHSFLVPRSGLGTSIDRIRSPGGQWLATQNMARCVALRLSSIIARLFAVTFSTNSFPLSTMTALPLQWGVKFQYMPCYENSVHAVCSLALQLAMCTSLCSQDATQDRLGEYRLLGKHCKLCY